MLGGVRAAMWGVVVLVCVSCSTTTTTATTSPTTGEVDTAECGGELAGFRHGTAEVNGGRVHYVVGGSGPAVVLLHGFPETWWTWREVMPRLARAHTVIALDLPGAGCSSIEPARYDSQTVAQVVHDLVVSLGLGPVAVVGHDTGGWVAYAYARQYRDQTSHVVLSGAAIPGFGLERLLDFREPGQGLAHLPFFMQPEVPESLIGGRERAYFGRFITSTAMARSGVIDVYARSYGRPGRLTAALGQYRALYVNAQDNRRGAGALLAMPTLALSGVGETALSADGLHQVARNVTEVAIPGGGHYVQEERPVEFAAAVNDFLR